ncbi:hypothetical protein [Pseudactinotalea sp. Z1732]|uniref:hypothetical protein n=1 Tax=Micrococcales TaxID=85006 RepID=UPI003C7E9D72
MQEIVQGNPKLRRVLYAAYAIVGLGLGSTQVGFSAAETGQPMWLTVALAVFAYVGVAFGFAAQSKVDATPAPHVTVVNPPPGAPDEMGG